MTDAPTLTPALQAQAEDAERLARAGQSEAAARLFRQVLQAAPDAARALSFFAMDAFARGELDEAQRLIDLASAGTPRLALVEAQRATILLARGDSAAALDAYESALQRDPGFVPVHFDAAQLLEDLGRPREAAEHYRSALARLPPPESLPPPLRERHARAQRALQREQAELESCVEQRLAPLRAGGDSATSARFDECLDVFLGRRQATVRKPGFMHFPGLQERSFFEREQFDWCERAEAATDVVREELLALLRQGREGFIPYVQKPDEESRPGSIWQPLNHKPDWGAYFLFNQGKRVDSHCAACPQTARLLESLPLVRIAGRGPTAFFSRLAPGTRIPPHHGATNTRVIVHLPLVIPPDCAIRVGDEVREWEPGKVLMFDDTVEHEAWNRSSEERAVLIFDVWNPYLSAHECELVTAMTEALAGFYPGEQHKTDF